MPFYKMYDANAKNVWKLKGKVGLRSKMNKPWNFPINKKHFPKLKWWGYEYSSHSTFSLLWLWKFKTIDFPKAIFYNKAHMLEIKFLEQRILKGISLSKVSSQSLRYDGYENLNPWTFPKWYSTIKPVR